MKVIAIIADIINSKEIDERKVFQNELAGCIEDINNVSNNILSPYTLTLGDEFQAIYKNGEEILDHIFNILVTLYPIRFRFSISYDELATDINRNRAIGMDGPVFYKAREGMNELKKINHSVIKIYGVNRSGDNLLNSGINLAMSVMDEWKENTFNIFFDLFKGLQVKEIISNYDLSRRGIYKLISRNKLWDFLEFFKCVRKELKMIKEIDNGY